jgi:hypothetical protein
MCERGLVEPVLETGGSDPCVLVWDEGAVVGSARKWLALPPRSLCVAARARRERQVVRGQQLKGLLHVLMLPDFERADRIGEIIR